MLAKPFILSLIAASVNAIDNSAPVIIIGSTGKKVSFFKSGGGTNGKAFLTYFFGSILLGLFIAGLLVFLCKFIRPSRVKLNEHNLEEFLAATRLFGDLRYQDPYPKPDVQIVTPLVLYKTYQRDLLMKFHRRLPMTLRELRNPTLALGPRRNVLLKC
jgi:hypothetical protein